ncbi:MAG: hypothetical protein JRH20_21350, partial [Deltaproteobacteria bacterium]|nr:hypothetical protein [Deltaproteobacteria bacterium]
MMMCVRPRLALLASVVFLSACPQEAGRRAVGGLSNSNTAAPPSGPITVHQGTPPFAKKYGGRTTYELSGADQKVLDLINRHSVALGRAPLSTDLQAHRASAEICRGLPRQGAPPAALVEFALRAHGLIHPPPHLIVGGVSDGDDIPASLAAKIEVLLARRVYRRVGLARCTPARLGGKSLLAGNNLLAGAESALATRERNSRRLVIALHESVARVRPLPRRMRLGVGLRVSAQVASSHHNIVLVVADPSGKVHHPALDRGGERVGQAVQGKVPCAKRGVYRVELTGVGSYGPEVLANFPIYCDQRPPSGVRYHSLLGGTRKPKALEVRLFDLTNAFRRRRGLASLRADAKLSAVARAHCEDMRGGGFVGHRSPGSGSPGDRIKRAGIVAL